MSDQHDQDADESLQSEWQQYAVCLRLVVEDTLAGIERACAKSEEGAGFIFAEPLQCLAGAMLQAQMLDERAARMARRMREGC